MTDDGPDGTPGEDLRLRLFDLIPDGLWMLDDRGRTLWANDRMAELLGRRPDEMARLSPADTLDEQGRQDFRRALEHMVRTGEGRDNLDACFIRPDGEAVWGLVSYRPVLDDTGERIGWLHRVTPYTERKNMLDSLAASEQQLADAQQIAHLGSWARDLRTEEVVWSDELYRIVGLEPQSEVVGWDRYLSLIHPDDRHLVGDAIAAARAGGDPTYTYQARIVHQATGAVRWVSARGVVTYDEHGTAVRTSGTVQDITDRRAADAQAEEAARRLFLLQQMATAANSATNLAEALLMAGVGLPEFTSWSAVGVHRYDTGSDEPELLDLRPPDVPVEWDPELAERARSTATVVVGSPPQLAATHSLVAMPVLIGTEVVCVVELLADEVPPDDNSFQLMAQIAHQLGVVAERERSEADLASARDAAMEASRLKSEFLATMSHEIRTPMNGVIGLTELLLRTELDEHQLRLAENLQGAGLTLLAIINDILDLSKIESGKLELEAADFDVRHVFDQVSSVLGGPAHEKGLELVVACAPDVPAQVRGDATRFGQIITNLGSNAVKFTDSGEVVIQARVESRTDTDVVLRVDVSDTGVGIEAGARDHLFDAFTQADPSTTRRHGGTGLGLAISKQLVEALGGQIWLSSEPGRGSTFSFTARLGAATGAAAAPPGGGRQLRDHRVLVVDDNETNRFILTEQLAAWEMRPVAVATAAEALDTLREGARSGQPFEAAILDLVMPGTDGLELAHRIGADPALTDLGLMLLTSDQSVSRQAIQDAGIHTALNKPVRHSELRGAMLAVLGGVTPAPARSARSGPALDVRVLVVEDNRVNQLVATGLLESLGCSVDLADDGVTAVERLTRSHGYDVVLMDCRMPNLDGFDATREIRAHEPVGRRVPIIAMTASALEGERERCLTAGMDDYLTKPIDSAELERVLREWVHAPAASPRPAPEPPAPADASGVLETARIAMLDELRKDGVSFFERTAASFMGRVGDQLVAIREAVGQDDAMGLLTSAHQLKGSALNLGLPRVGEASARLEALGIAGTTEGAGPLLDDLTAEVEIAVAALQRATTEGR